MPRTLSNYAQEIKVIRDLLGLTQADMGRLLGITRSSVVRYENGARKVPEPIIRLTRQLYLMKQAYREEETI